VFVQD